MTDSSPETTPSDLWQFELERIGWTVARSPGRPELGRSDRPRALGPSRVHPPLRPEGRGTDRSRRLQRRGCGIHGHPAYRPILTSEQDRPPHVTGRRQSRRSYSQAAQHK